MANFVGTSGGDTYLGGPDADYVEGLGGADSLYGGGGDDEILGGDGDDLLDGQSGIDILRGEGGNDLLWLLDYFGSTTTVAGEMIDGGEGVDTLYFYLPTLSAAVAFSIADPSVPQNLAGATLVNVEQLLFTSGTGDDNITGGALNDDIRGRDGNDVINGGGGEDVIYGGNGNDVLSGGADDDFINGEAGDDQLSGGSGNDFLRGNAGVDSYDGGPDDGTKISFVNGVGDRISFGDASAGQGAIADLRTGIISNDGYGNAETMTGIESLGPGTAFADQFYGDDNVNSISGGRGDTLMAFGGDDFLSVSGAPAVLDGGAGTDRLTLAASGGLVPNESGTGGTTGPAMTVGYTIDLAAQTLTDGHGYSGSIAGIERIRATDLDDVIRGSGDDEWFAPGWGNDSIDGRGGVDTASYAHGTHYDYYYSYKGGIFVDLALGQIKETLLPHQVVPTGFMQGRVAPPPGTTGADAAAEYTDAVAGIENIEGTGVGDTLYGDGADNRFAPGAGSDIVDGRGGIDTVDYSTARAAVVVRLDQGNAVEGGTGETDFDFGVPNYSFGIMVEADDYSEKTDQLANIENAVGSAFADVLVGGGGANRLEGGAGDDALTGQAGADALVGGAGTDTADYSLESGGLGVVVNLSANTVFAPNALVLSPGQARDSYGNVDTLEGIENVRTGGGSDLVYGDSGANRIETGGGADSLYGGAGADTMIGGSGDDSYYILAEDAAAFEDVIVELQGGGTDVVRTTMSVFSLAGIAEVEYLMGFADTGQVLTGNDLGNYIQGSVGGDTLIGGLGNDELVGLGGNDIMRGGLGDDSYRVEDSGDVVEENAGEGMDSVFTSLAVFSLLATHVENLVALNDIAHEFRGSAAGNLIVGGAGIDRFLLQDGGEDRAAGGAGNDLFYFGSALSAGDVADGGDGRDAIVLQGHVTAVLSETNFVGIESISIQSGANASFGDTANNFYDYDVTTADGNVLAGQQLIVNAQSLRAGEDFTFDGSAETDGRFLIYGGHGTDNLTGGDGVDVFFFEGQRWTAGDKVDGGAGRDALVISGGDGLTRIEFATDSFTNIESISVNNRYATDPSQHPSYELVLNNGNVAPGATLIVNGSSIPLGQVVNIDGRAIQDGSLVLFGGGGHDVLIGGSGADLIIGGGGQDSLTGGAGADIFRYDAVSDSPAGATDLIADFQTGTDKIDLSRIDADTTLAGDQSFTWIGASAFSGTAGQLRVRDEGGYRYLEGDTNGDGQADFAIAFYAVAAPQVPGDFLL